MVRAELEALAQQLADDACRVVEATRRAGMRGAEDDLSGAARMDLVAAVRRWLDETSDIVTAAEEGFSDGENGDDEPRTPEELIVDIAAMGSIAIAEQQRLMRQLDASTDHWDVIERCDSSLRAIVRTATAIEGLLSAYCGDPPRIVADDELENALRVRRLYDKFVRAITEHVSDESRPLARRIRSAGTALAMLIGHAEYPLMRVGDRILVRKLQRRVIEWSTSPAQTQTDGDHLCSELLAVAELLMAINSRAELQEYDRKQAGSAAIAEELITWKEGD